MEVFGLPGVHNLALWEALRASPIRLVGVRHEQAAAYAADGYARATGRLGVALTTTGPGAANTLGAVGEAWASRSPILVIATDIPSSLRRPGVYRGVLHETVRPGGDVRARWSVAAPRAGAGGRRFAASPRSPPRWPRPRRPVYLEIADRPARAPRSRRRRSASRPSPFRRPSLGAAAERSTPPSGR